MVFYYNNGDAKAIFDSVCVCVCVCACVCVCVCVCVCEIKLTAVDCTAESHVQKQFFSLRNFIKSIHFPQGVALFIYILK